MIESQHLTNTNTQHLTDLIYIKFWHSSSSVSHTYTTSVGRTRCDFFFVFIFCLHQHFLHGEEFPLVYIPLTWTSSTPSFFEPVPDLVTGTLAAGILFFILANFFFPLFNRWFSFPLTVPSISQPFFVNNIPPTRYLLSTSGFLPWV